MVRSFPLIESVDKLPVVAYEPIGDRVLLRMSKEDPNAMKNVGGVLVPAEQSRNNNPIRECTVDAAGPDCKQVKKGDFVMFNLLNFPPLPIGGEDLYFVPEPNLITVVRRA